MGKIIKKDVVKRQKGYLYYIDGKGNLCEAKMSRGGKKRKKITKKKKKEINYSNLFSIFLFLICMFFIENDIYTEILLILNS